MCLSTITELNPKKQEGTGYKLVRKKKDGEYYTGYLQAEQPDSVVSHQPLPLLKWVKDKTPISTKLQVESIRLRNRPYTYQAGFHLFKNLDALRHFRRVYGWRYALAVRVEYKRVTATGKQDVSEVIVARYLKRLGPTVKE